jgi:HSP20 family protein
VARKERKGKLRVIGPEEHKLPGDPGNDRTSSWMPPVDIYETRDRYVLNAELPGVEIGDVHIEVSGCDITIRGGRRLGGDCLKENYHCLEGSRGWFSRTFTLPETLDRHRVRATLEEGVLHVTIAKATGARKCSSDRLTKHG